jgi:hypothetical protein
VGIQRLAAAFVRFERLTEIVEFVFVGLDSSGLVLDLRQQLNFF